MSVATELEPHAAPDIFAASRTDSAPGMDVAIDLRRVVTVLLFIVTTLLITGTIADFIIYRVAPSLDHKLARMMSRFDLGFEPSLPNWYSSFALLASSGLLALIARGKRQAGDRFSKHWLGMAVIFLGLSIDEGVRFHEMIHTAIASQIETHGLLYFPWVVPALLFVAAFVVCYVPFLKHLDRRTAVLFVGAGAVYVMGAVGFDVIGGLFMEQGGAASLGHIISQTFEEMFEMLGIVLFLYALLDHIRRSIGPMRFVVANLPSQRPARLTNGGL